MCALLKQISAEDWDPNTNYTNQKNENDKDMNNRDRKHEKNEVVIGRVLNYIQNFVGAEKRVSCNLPTYLSLISSDDHHLKALAYWMKANSMLDGECDVGEIVELYQQISSIEMNTELLAESVTALANQGKLPKLDAEVLEKEVCEAGCELLKKCGMNGCGEQLNICGEGGSYGGSFVIVPNMLSMAFYSPTTLDINSNSEFAVSFTKRFNHWQTNF